MHLLNPMYQQPQWLITILLLIYLGEFWGYLTLFHRAMLLKVRPTIKVFTIIPALVDHFVLQCLIEAQPGAKIRPVIIGPGLKQTFNSLPCFVILILTVGTLSFLVFLSRNTVKVMRNSISPSSIKISLDNLPNGICFYSHNGTIRLINDEMIKILVNGMGGLVPKNGNKLKDELIIGTAGDDPVSLGRYPVYRMADGRYVAFTFSDIAEGNITAHEIIAVDVTETYTLNKKIEEENATQAVNVAMLRDLDKTITNVTIQREELEAKTRIHDNLGQVGLLARRYLDKGCSGKEKKRLIAMWRENLDFLRAESDSADNVITPISRIMQTARDVGVKLDIQGGLPRSELGLDILATAMHECLTNTIRHGGGDAMKVVLSHERARMHCEISNNGEVPKEKIKETGGLANLRNRIESEKGHMSIETDNEFKIVIDIPTGGR